MQKLIEGIHRFRKESFSQYQTLFENLVEGQHPLALFITCSDSRIDPSRLTQTTPGDLFVERTAGNIVPPYGAVQGGEAATIEYAIRALELRDIVICGHSHCGAIKGLLNPQSLEKMPAVRAYLQHAEATRRILDENYPTISDPERRLNLAIQENVLVQLENLKTHPTVAAAIGRGQLKLHGWVYKFETGEVFSFDPERGQFLPLGEGNLPVPVPNRPLPPI